MSKIKKAQFGRSQRAIKADFESSKNPKVTYPSSRIEATVPARQLTAVTADTTGYAAGKKRFPAETYERTSRFSPTYTPAKPLYKMESRRAVTKGMKKMGITPKKTGGKVAAKQLGRMKTTIGNKSFAKSKKK